VNYVYLLRCGDDSLYCGWTTDLQNRLKAHTSGKGAKYTRSRLPVTLVWWKTFATRQEAMSREWHIKHLSKAEKEALIQKERQSRSKTMELFEGRPEDIAGRLPREIRTYDFLDRLGIHYQRTDHDRADNMEACNRIDAVLGVLICKNLFLCNRQQTVFYLLMMPGDKKFKTKELSAQIGSARLSFADSDAMLKYLDIEPGAVSVMGLMNDTSHVVHLLIDEDVLKGEFLGCHPCVCTSSLKIKTRDITELFLPATGHDYEVVHLTGVD